MVRRSLWFMVLLGAVAPVPAHSHPHVWVDARVVVTLASGVVQGLQVELTFDDMFSAMVLQDVAPGAKTLTPRAIEAIRATYFQDLGYFQYFIQLNQGKKALKVPPPEGFTASLEPQGRVRYRFSLPLGVRLSATSPLVIGVYDESFYVDVQPALKDPVGLVTTGPGKASYEWVDGGGKPGVTGTPGILNFRLRWAP